MTPIRQHDFQSCVYDCSITLGGPGRLQDFYIFTKFFHHTQNRPSTFLTGSAMALRSAWWMQPQPDRDKHGSFDNPPDLQEHLQWPWSWHPDLMEHRNIEHVLQKSEHIPCSVESYCYTPAEGTRWRHEGTADKEPDLVDLLRRQAVS